ncbi:aminotransferase class III-fold pyridoxal phosphate-dependent enzyme, partial [Streptomyces antimycoticus]|uniref:aminotransferase class III-fold pyridoxal phosphate-dependent enzyme n=1 Tax=Streptomyces antimycoticus TaxID=68175 RepID=UPI00191B9C9A
MDVRAASSLDETLARGRRALLHQSPQVSDEMLTLVQARGSLVWDVNGREYLDCTAQAWSNNLGANDPRVV